VSKRKNRRRHSPHRQSSAATEIQPAVTVPVESRLAEAATVGWMLSTVVTLAAEVAVALLVFWRWLAPDNQVPAILSELFGLCAVVVATMSLLLAAVALSSRRVSPPRVVTVVALAAGALPLVLVAYRMWH
jgi:hypothetical protein